MCIRDSLKVAMMTLSSSFVVLVVPFFLPTLPGSTFFKAQGWLTKAGGEQKDHWASQEGKAKQRKPKKSTSEKLASCIDVLLNAQGQQQANWSRAKPSRSKQWKAEQSRAEELVYFRNV